MPYLGKQSEDGGAVVSTYEFVQATDTSSGTTSFPVPSTGGDYIRVFVNGTLKREGASNDYTVTSSAIVFGSAPADAQVIKVDVFESVTIWDTVPKTGGTFSGNVVFGGTVTMQSANNQGFASGTKMLFQQTAAPTGWTKVTSSNDVALRVVSGTVGSGGSVAFETAFASQTIPVHTLAISEIPAHSHSVLANTTHGGTDYVTKDSSSQGAPGDTASVGGGGSHGHGSIDLDVQYVDVIIATKD